MIKVSSGLVPSKGYEGRMCSRPLSLAIDGHLPVSSYHLPSVHVCVQISSFYKDTSHNGLGLTLVSSFKLYYLSKDPISK